MDELPRENLDMLLEELDELDLCVECRLLLYDLAKEVWNEGYAAGLDKNNNPE